MQVFDRGNWIVGDKGKISKGDILGSPPVIFLLYIIVIKNRN